MSTPEQQLSVLRDLLRLTITLSTEFINLPVDRIDDRIHAALQTICEKGEIDRVGINLFSDDGLTFVRTHEWCAPDVVPTIHKLQGVRLDHLPWLIDQYRKLNPIVLNTLDELPAEAVAEREFLPVDGVRSLLGIPLIWARQAIGYVSFTSVRRAVTWDPKFLDVAKVLAEILVNAMQRKRAEEAIRRSERIAVEFQDKLKTLVELNIELGRTASLEDLPRHIVELGRSILGFERLALLVLSEGGRAFRGTFGTDMLGQTTDERTLHGIVAGDPRLAGLLSSGERISLHDESATARTTPDLPGKGAPRKGWHAIIPLRNVDTVIGWLSVDNHIHLQPLRPYDAELLVLYGAIVGHLIAQKRTEEANQRYNLRLRNMWREE